MSVDRGTTPVVGKALEIAVLVLLTALLVALLFGGTLPAYRTAAGAELADRTTARAAEAVERAVPSPTRSVRHVDAERRVRIPTRIRGRTYRIRGDGRTLVLDHPTPGVGGRVSLALRPSATVGGEWESDARTLVRVQGAPSSLRVRLETRGGGP